MVRSVRNVKADAAVPGRWAPVPGRDHACSACCHDAWLAAVGGREADGVVGPSPPGPSDPRATPATAKRACGEGTPMGPTLSTNSTASGLPGSTLRNAIAATLHATEACRPHCLKLTLSSEVFCPRAGRRGFMQYSFKGFLLKFRRSRPQWGLMMYPATARMPARCRTLCCKPIDKPRDWDTASVKSVLLRLRLRMGLTKPRALRCFSTASRSACSSAVLRRLTWCRDPVRPTETGRFASAPWSPVMGTSTCSILGDGTSVRAMVSICFRRPLTMSCTPADPSGLFRTLRRVRVVLKARAAPRSAEYLAFSPQLDRSSSINLQSQKARGSCLACKPALPLDPHALCVENRLDDVVLQRLCEQRKLLHVQLGFRKTQHWA